MLGHGEQAAPQVITLALLTHAPSQRWNPTLHVNPQVRPSQLGMAFGGGAGQAVHAVPQCATSTSATQAAPQRW